MRPRCVVSDSCSINSHCSVALVAFKGADDSNIRPSATVVLPTSEATAAPFSLRRLRAVWCSSFPRIFGGHDPKFRLILHLFHYRYGTILPSSVPGTGCHLRADHPLSISHFSCRFYDADDPSVVTSIVPDSTIGGVCSIGRKNNEGLTSIPRQGIGGIWTRRSWLLVPDRVISCKKDTGGMSTCPSAWHPAL